MEPENHHLEKESTEFGDCRILAGSNCGQSISSRYSTHKDMFSHHSMTTQIPYNMRHAVLQMKDHIKVTQAKPKTSILCKFDQIHAEHFLGQTTLPSRRGSFAKSWCRAARKPSNGSTSPRFIKHPVLFNWNFPYVWSKKHSTELFRKNINVGGVTLEKLSNEPGLAGVCFSEVVLRYIYPDKQRSFYSWFFGRESGLLSQHWRFWMHCRPQKNSLEAVFFGVPYLEDVSNRRTQTCSLIILSGYSIAKLGVRHLPKKGWKRHPSWVCQSFAKSAVNHFRGSSVQLKNPIILDL